MKYKMSNFDVTLILHNPKKLDELAGVHICDNCCTELTPVESVNYLGIIIDQNLNWKLHIDNLANEVRKINYLFYRIKKFLSWKILKNLYFALYQSKLNYGLALWGGTFDLYLHKLKTSQNFIIRALFGKRGDYSVTKLYKKHEILPINLLYHYNLILHVLHYRSDYQPYIFNRNTRNATLPLLKIPSQTKTNCRNNITYMAPYLFNQYLKNSPSFLATIENDFSLTTQKKILKSYIMGMIPNL